MKRLILFTRWWKRHGGNAHMIELEKAYQAGWKAALREHKKKGCPPESSDYPSGLPWFL